MATWQVLASKLDLTATCPSLVQMQLVTISSPETKYDQVQYKTATQNYGVHQKSSYCSLQMNFMVINLMSTIRMVLHIAVPPYFHLTIPELFNPWQKD